MIFSERLALLLGSKGITAYRLHKEIGVTSSILSDWLAGKRLPNGENLIKLADYFDVSIDYLLGRTDNPLWNKPNDSHGATEKGASIGMVARNSNNDKPLVIDEDMARKIYEALLKTVEEAKTKDPE